MGDSLNQEFGIRFLNVGLIFEDQVWLKGLVYRKFVCILP